MRPIPSSFRSYDLVAAPSGVAFAGTEDVIDHRGDDQRCQIPHRVAYHYDPVRDALQTVRRHAARIIRRWNSGHSNARLEALNGLFQAARARARGYRNTATFACIIYLIGAPIGDLLDGRLST